MNNRLFILALICLITANLICQQIDQIPNSDPLKVSGFLSTNQVISNQGMADSVKINYTSYYSGSLNFDIYGFSVPLTFIYTNEKTQFTHPFNQLSLHPSYKNLIAHIGNISMSLSPYTLSGHLLKGAGMEYTYKSKYSIKAVGGELNRRVTGDTLNQNIIPSYQRLGYGINVGYKNEGDAANLIFFSASDRIESEQLISNKVFPQQNNVISFLFQKSLFERVTLSAEFANSIYTSDRRAGNSENSINELNPNGWFISQNSTTISRNAFKSNIVYRTGPVSTGIGYERIDPGYTTLGTYYFTNNMENITVQFSGAVWENKISFGLNAGIQHDNLDHNSAIEKGRFAGSGNLSYQCSEKLNFSVSYSNFTGYTNMRSSFDYINQTSPYENYDTLNFRQISQNSAVSFNYQPGSSKDINQSVSAGLNYQVSEDGNEIKMENRGRFYNLNGGYTISFIPQNLHINVHLNYNLNEVAESPSSTIGPGLSVSKMLLKKTLKVSGSFNYNLSKTDTLSQSTVYNSRAGLTYIFRKQHQLNVHFVYQNRTNNTNQQQAKSLNIISATLAYAYNFSFTGIRARNEH